MRDGGRQRRVGRGRQPTLHDVALLEPARFGFSSLDLFHFVRNKLRGVRFATLEDLRHEWLTIAPVGAVSIFNKTQTKL